MWIKGTEPDTEKVTLYIGEEPERGKRVSSIVTDRHPDDAEHPEWVRVDLHAVPDDIVG